MPKSIKDSASRDKIATSVVKTFDGHVITLKRVCEAIREGEPTDMVTVAARIEKERKKEERLARAGWHTFTFSLEKKLGTDYDATALEDAVKLLLEGRQFCSFQLVDLLWRRSPRPLMDARDLGLFNADAGYHPLAIDRFKHTLSLRGKAIERVLREKYNLPKQQ
jgi:hypothetical protein